MTESVEVFNDHVSKELFNPHNFAELFQHLRLREHLSTSQLAKIVSYSQHSIKANEDTMRNPTTKTLMRYIQKLHLELSITKEGITIRDPSSGVIIVNNWNVSFC